MAKVQDIPEPQFGSFFREALVMWSDLNLTAKFKEFMGRVSDMTLTLPLILFHKEKIFLLLEEYILLKDPLFLEPMLK